MREKQVENYLAKWTGFSRMMISSNKPNVRRLLSETLETGEVPQRFYLSQKACQGILRRAEKRGKQLPDQLRMALESVANG